MSTKYYNAIIVCVYRHCIGISQLLSSQCRYSKVNLFPTVYFISSLHRWPQRKSSNHSSVCEIDFIYLTTKRVSATI